MISLNVTMTTNGVNYNLLTLIQVALPTFVLDECKQLQVQLDPESNAGTNTIRRGDSTLSDTVYAALFTSRDFDTWGPLDSGGIFLGDFNYRCSADGKKLHVTAVMR